MTYQPIFWGRQMWHSMHMVALSFPDNPTQEQQEKFRNFYESIANVLPCPTCAANYGKKLKEYPIQLDSRDSLFRWTVDIHNMVNKKNGKRELSYDEAIKEVGKNAKNNIPKGLGDYKGLLLLSIVVVGAVWFLKIKQ